MSEVTAQAMKPASGANPKEGRWFVLVFLLVGLTLFLRRPDALLNPQFWAEDGNLFFAQQFYGEASLLQPYSGYLHVVPRLVAGLADFFHAVQVPLIYNLVTLVLSALCCAWFVRPAFSYLVRDVRLRAFACLLIAAMPGVGAVLLNLTNLQWYLSVWAGLVCLSPLPRARWQFLLLAAYLLVLFTAPITLVLTPIWALRAALRRADRLVGGVIVLVQIGYALWIRTSSESIPQAISFFDSLAPAFKLTASRIGLMNLLGPDLLARLNQTTLTVAGLLLLALFGLLLWRGRVRRDFLVRTAIMLYLVFGSIVIYLTSKGIETPTNDIYFSVGGARYFFFGTVVFQIWLISLVDGFRADPVVRRAAIAVLVLMTLVAARCFFMVPAFDDTNWRRWAEGLEQARKSGSRFIFDVPINPRPWTIPGSRRLPPDTRSTPMALTTTDVIGLVRSGEAWRPQGANPSLTFSLDQPAYVYGIQLAYTLTGRAPARVSWRFRPGTEFLHDPSLQNLPPTGGEPAKRTVWVLDRVTEFRIELDGADFSFQPAEIILLVAPRPPGQY